MYGYVVNSKFFLINWFCLLRVFINISVFRVGCRDILWISVKLMKVGTYVD